MDDRSGEISTVALLDYEKRNQFHIIAIPIKGGGENREILVEVEDENDNSPVFPDDRIKVWLFFSDTNFIVDDKIFFTNDNISVSIIAIFLWYFVTDKTSFYF